MKISIVIVTYNSENHIFDCLESVFLHNDIGDQLEIIVVDNSIKDSEPMFNAISKCYPNNRIKLIKNEFNGGYGQGNNVGVRNASSPIIMIMNPDVRLLQSVFVKSLSHFANPKTVMLGMKQMINPVKRGLSFMVKLDTDPILAVFETILFNKLQLYNPCRMYFSGASFFIRKKDFEDLGMFDENVFMYGEENDLHHRLRTDRRRLNIIYDRKMSYLHLVDNRPPTIQSAINMLNASFSFYKKNGYDEQKIIKREIKREIRRANFFRIIELLKKNDTRVAYYSEWLTVLNGKLEKK
jgi:GT2 family glycosyltransferase